MFFKKIYYGVHWGWLLLCEGVRSWCGKPRHRHLTRQLIAIPYEYSGHPYQYVLAKKRGVRPVTSVTDHTGADVTGAVLPMMGPNFDWHNTPIKPADLGFESLTFANVMGETWSVLGDELLH